MVNVRFVVPPRLSISYPAGNCCPQLRVLGAAGARYAIEKRLTLFPSNAWQPMATNITDTSGT